MPHASKAMPKQLSKVANKTTIGDLWQTMTATATRTWQNKRSNGQNNSVSNFCTFLFRPLLNNNVISRKNLRDMSMETTMTTYHKEAIRAVI